VSGGPDPRDFFHQIAEHLRLEAEFGGDWIPVVRRRLASPPEQPARQPRSSSPPSAPGPTFRSRASEPPPEARGPRGKGLSRPDPPVRTTDPEACAAGRAGLDAIAAEIMRCKACALHEGRTNTVPGHGHPAARLCFVGEGPGADEDATGLPFVGRAGKLLTRMIEAIGLERSEVFICNTVKCRPPGNRTPESSEMRTCWPFLERQIEVVRPDVIVALGRPAAQMLLATDRPMNRLRGRFFRFRRIPVMPTYHPAYLLRNPAAKSDSWADLKKVHEFLAGGRIDEEEGSAGDAVESSAPASPPDSSQGKLFG